LGFEWPWCSPQKLYCYIMTSPQTVLSGQVISFPAHLFSLSAWLIWCTFIVWIYWMTTRSCVMSVLYQFFQCSKFTKFTSNSLHILHIRVWLYQFSQCRDSQTTVSPLYMTQYIPHLHFPVLSAPSSYTTLCLSVYLSTQLQSTWTGIRTDTHTQEKPLLFPCPLQPWPIRDQAVANDQRGGNPAIRMPAFKWILISWEGDRFFR